ncbi:hypothetical protein BC940DRAFT_346817 [Gongronella butleri]|nr:hypothetical protein BC940DRAFT_346817 [Gongronella butleri]
MLRHRPSFFPARVCCSFCLSFASMYYPKDLDPTKSKDIEFYLRKGLSDVHTALLCDVSFHAVGRERRKRNFSTIAPSVVKKVKKLLNQGQEKKHIAWNCGVKMSAVFEYEQEIKVVLAMEKLFWAMDKRTKDDIKLLFHDGIPTVDIAEICEVTERAIRRVLYLSYIPEERSHTHDADIVDRIYDQLTRCDPIKTVAQDCGVKFRTVTLVRNKYNLKDHHLGVHLSKDKIDEIRQCLLRGMPSTAASRSCGIHSEAILNIARQYNIPLAYAQKRMTPAMREEMKRRLEQGESCRVVAAACGVCETTVRKCIKAIKIASQSAATLVINEQKIETPPQTTENALSNMPTSAPSAPSRRIEFLDEIPFCILI